MNSIVNNLHVYTLSVLSIKPWAPLLSPQLVITSSWHFLCTSNVHTRKRIKVLHTCVLCACLLTHTCTLVSLYISNAPMQYNKQWLSRLCTTYVSLPNKITTVGTIWKLLSIHYHKFVSIDNMYLATECTSIPFTKGFTS